jgi:hypothetical protein
MPSRLWGKRPTVLAKVEVAADPHGGRLLNPPSARGCIHGPEPVGLNLGSGFLAL